MQEEFQTTGF
jgi:hypothetical protein